MKFLYALLLLSFLTFVTSNHGRSHDGSSSSLSSDSSDSKHHGKIRFNYILWFGDDIYRRESLRLRSPYGIFFVDAMDQAADMDNDFKFEGTNNPEFGKFITKIGGVANDPTNNKFWMLYDLTSEPNVHHKPGDDKLSPLGVSSLKVQNNHYYLFWHKTVVY